MDQLVKFIASALKLEPQHYDLSYTDEEGDEISIVSDADLKTAQELNHGKNFLKVNLISKQEAMVTQPAQDALKNKDEKAKMRDERRMKREERRKSRQEKKGSQEKKEECSSSEDRWHKRLAKFTQMLADSSSEEKDPRVKVLIPCLKTEGNGIQKLSKESVSLGEEYQGYLVPLPKLFRMLRKEGKDRRSHSRGKRSPESLERMFFEKKCRKLSKIYGGKPEEYQEFVENNRDLRIAETMVRYAATHHEDKEAAEKKLVDFRAGKLAKWFDKPAENFTEFVQKHLDLKPRELFKNLIETGVEQKPNRSPRRCEKSKEENKSKAKEERLSREERRASRQAKKQQRLEAKEEQTARPEKNEGKRFSPLKAKQGGEGRGRGKMIQTMIDLFGRQNIKDYLKLIEEHGSEGQERVVELYIEQLAKQA